MALALRELGRTEDARARAGEEVELARRFGARRPLGIALRAAGVVGEGEGGLESLAESVAVLADSPVIAYAVKQSGGQFEVSGATYDTAPYGIAVAKSLGTTKEAVLGALKALQSDGSYTKILSKWGVQSGAITNPVINGATS